MNDKSKRKVNEARGNFLVGNNSNLHKSTGSRLVRKGELIRFSRGIYYSPEYQKDDFFLLQSRFSKGIYSFETALHIHGLLTENKINSMTFPRGYGSKNTLLKDLNIKAHYSSLKFYDIGLELKKSSTGKKIKVYDLERSLCDIWHNKSRYNESYQLELLRLIIKSKEFRIDVLKKYMYLLPISKKLPNIIEGIDSSHNF
ncbi:type IV toxin-antitoxin system AbiEi family antitoxin domain-containing protein [Enterococcus faecium]|uniref:type IV toxin-antitoxin system AbiEi family antitoxin domain-containing protein n=1 Tax=Enterococcus faecium TaxID=1352 RepID=UPI000BF21380|nr:type IV toxin-antitoxin system AbiEi family antitoxin domain-containing protein [Enterococcus faecium]PEH49545.1 hypothetical protein CRM75_01960 [Enterococcus faecium]